jgi:hypothetical protein
MDTCDGRLHAPIRHEVAEPVWTLWRGKESLPGIEHRFPGSLAHIPVTILMKLPRLLVCTHYNIYKDPLMVLNLLSSELGCMRWKELGHHQLLPLAFQAQGELNVSLATLFFVYAFLSEKNRV